MNELEKIRYVDTVCAGCGVPVVSVPEHAHEARCIDCARNVAGCKWSPFDAVAAWHPTERYGSYAIELPETEREPYPAPEHIGPVIAYSPASVLGIAGEMAPIAVPASVLALAGYAYEKGWKVGLQYSRGHFPHGTTGKPTALRHVIGMRFGDHPETNREAYAIYSKPVNGGTWSWTSIMIWGPDLPPYGDCGHADLSAYLHEVGVSSSAQGMISWVDDLRTIKANGEILRKKRAEEKKSESFPKPREGAS